MKFIVDRKKWYRGQGSDESNLLREDGSRCCIGFVGQQCGVPDSLMLHRPCIQEGQLDTLQGFPKWMYANWGPYDTLVGEAYTCNDNESCGDEVREVQLKIIFAKHGDEIEFVG